MKRDESAAIVWWAVEVFRDRWFVAILHQLLSGKKRQSELLREIDGITQRMLTRTLRHMERDGIVARNVVRAKPLYVDYRLTALGESLRPVLHEILKWGIERRLAVERSRADFDG